MKPKRYFWMAAQFCAVLAVPLAGRNFHVQPQGSDTNDGASFARAFKTIQAATNRAAAGDSILVYDGYYKGFDHFYKNSGTAEAPIVYFAVGNKVIINQSCGRGYDGINIEGNDYIHVVGFKVIGISDPAGSGEDGIRAVDANHITIRFCEVDSCYRGIFTGYTDYFLAEYNVCKRSYGEHGIYVSNNSDHVVIRHNVCYENRRAAGIQINPDLSSGSPGLSYDVSIHHNICHSNRIGLNLQGMYYSEVYNNLIYNNGSGNAGNGMTFFWGDAATGCNAVKVYNNTVVVPSGSQWAILAADSDSLEVYNNILVSFSAKGCIDIESSCTHYLADHNILNNRMTVNQGQSYIDFKQWQRLGYDIHSILVEDNLSLFENLAMADFHLSRDSKARNTGSDLVSHIVVNDLDLQRRPQGNAYDIGCYEYPETTQPTLAEFHRGTTWSRVGNQLIKRTANGEAHLWFFDIQGHIIEWNTVINLDNLPQGMYIIYAQDNKTGRAEVTKFLNIRP